MRRLGCECGSSQSSPFGVGRGWYCGGRRGAAEEGRVGRKGTGDPTADGVVTETGGSRIESRVLGRNTFSEGPSEDVVSLGFCPDP